jgi:hypothetical protein
MDPIMIPIVVSDSTPLAGQLAETAKWERARGEISNLRDAIADLKRHMEKQATLLRAMFALVSERTSLTEAELLARFQLIESASGASAQTVLCTQCDRPINLRHNRCLYCGAVRQVESAFDLL